MREILFFLIPYVIVSVVSGFFGFFARSGRIDHLGAELIRERARVDGRTIRTYRDPVHDTVRTDPAPTGVHRVPSTEDRPMTDAEYSDMVNGRTRTE